LASDKNQLKVFQRNFEILKADKKLCTKTTERQHSNQQQQKIDTLTSDFAYLTSYLIKLQTPCKSLRRGKNGLNLGLFDGLNAACKSQLATQTLQLATSQLANHLDLPKTNLSISIVQKIVRSHLKLMVNPLGTAKQRVITGGVISKS
jgi:hypothetical protein